MVWFGLVGSIHFVFSMDTMFAMQPVFALGTTLVKWCVECLLTCHSTLVTTIRLEILPFLRLYRLHLNTCNLRHSTRMKDMKSDGCQVFFPIQCSRIIRLSIGLSRTCSSLVRESSDNYGVQGNPYSLLGLRKRHADQNSGLLHIVMRIAHNTDGAWLHHHCKGETHGVEKPSLRECAQDVAVCYLIETALET